MASVKEMLKKSLDELGSAELKTFQWHLLNDHECISKCDMENADRLKTVDIMVACFRSEEAVKIAVNILRKMNQNLLAEKLEKKHKEGSTSYPVGNNSDARTTRFSNLKSVSTATEKDKLCLNTVEEKATFFDDNWSKLIQRVKNVKTIADRLRQQKIIQPEQYSEITQDSLTSEKSMRKICEIIDNHNNAVKAKFISILQEEERCLLENWSD
ncbi:apoptosis-associated speck-like protein containing a CARD [Megalobrama amblycephala]|uniref:apoptosis-associated speck-like protein containing a CARD n=1 Tax=Megalobrama amblycephala TaxID=75352 RepID=UPI002013FCCD|nr:apoptosis-associated speck-like protein containing a CARD [Megalobrama amblycephala]